MYNQRLEQLTAYATSESFQPEVLAAREEYTGLVDKVLEDDRSFEARMSAFLEFYLFDRVLPSRGVTPAQLYLNEVGKDLQPSERAEFEGFTRTVHSLFEVRKILNSGALVRDLFTGVDQEVFERRSMVGLQKGDILEARLIPSEGHLHFSPAFCYHPKEARPNILAELKRQKKSPASGFTPKAFIYTLSRMSLKVERYRNIAVENIYTFGSKTGEPKTS